MQRHDREFRRNIADMCKRRGLSLLLIMAFLLSTVSASTAEVEGFPDVPSHHWAYEHIVRLVRRGVINGKPDGTFAPEEEVTREQFAKLMALRFYLPVSEVEATPYADVDPESWAAPYITACQDHLNASADRFTAQMHFRPQDPATREEVIAALMRVMEIAVDRTDTAYALEKFSDAGAIDPVALPYVSAAAQMGLVTGYPDGTFGPQRPVTRSEAAALLERAIALTEPEEDPSVAATVNGYDLTVAEMDFYYWDAVNRHYAQEQLYAQLYLQAGMDYTPTVDLNADLRQQYTGEKPNQSYHDYFLDQAKRMAAEFLALSDAAEAAGYTLSSEGWAQMEETKAYLAEVAASYNLSRLDYLRLAYGPYITLDIYFRATERKLLATEYYNAVTESFAVCADEELEAYYVTHPDLLDGYDSTFAFFDGWPARVEDEEGNEIPATEEEKAAAMAKAKRDAEGLLAALRADSATDFSTLAERYGVVAYELEEAAGINMENSPVAPWLMDPARADGDTEIFELDGQGYYVVRFQGRKEKVTGWEDFAAEAMARSREEDFAEKTMAGYEVQEGPAWVQVGLRNGLTS